MLKLRSFFLLLLLFVVSCQPNPKMPEKKVRINLVTDPRTLDPRKSRDLGERTLVSMFFEGLTREGKSGKSELALADRFEIQNDGLRYLFYLKKAFWSNGDPIKAQDFVYSWKTSLDPLFPSENAYQLFCIKNAEAVKKGEKSPHELGVEALDEMTLQIDLEKPVPYLLELLSFSIFFPVHSSIDSTSNDSLVCSGPFLLNRWKHNDFIDTVKNERYWDSQSVRLEGVHLVMVTEETEIRMFEKKELDWAGSPISTLPFDLIELYADRKNLKQYPMFGTFFLRINVEKPPFNNPNIRKALALSINRKALVEHVTKAGYSPAQRFVPDSMGIEAAPFFQDADDDLAKELFQKGLEELHMTKDSFPKIVFLYSALQKNHAVSQALQQDWHRVLGISVELEPNEKKVYFERIGKADYQIAMGSWFADFNDPVNFLNIFKYKYCSTNNTLWQNEEYTCLLNASEIAGKNERADLLKRCESILMEEMPIIPIYHPHMRYVQQEYLKDVVLSSLGSIDFKWAYLEK